jgi:hypothetical protein
MVIMSVYMQYTLYVHYGIIILYFLGKRYKEN